MFAMRRALQVPRRTFHWTRLVRDAEQLGTEAVANADSEPTLEALDALQPKRPSKSRVLSAQTARTTWDTTFKRLQASFTRPQLYRLSKEANLKNIKTSLSKSDLVRAILQQRFALHDPNAAVAASTLFLPLALSEVFLLASHGHEMFRIARDASASFSIEKRNGETGAVIRGSDDAIASVRDWVQTFRRHIHKAEVKLPFDAPTGLLRRIAEVSGCYIEQHGASAQFQFVDATAAHTASVLLEQSAVKNTPKQLACFGVSGDRLNAVPFAPGSLSCVDDTIAMQNEHVRYMAPTDAAMELQLDHHLWDQLQDMAHPVSLPNSLLEKEWERRLEVSFGHAVYPADAPQSNAVDSLDMPRFLPSFPPSCINEPMQLGPYVPEHKNEFSFVRLYYRGYLASRPVDLVVSLNKSQRTLTFQGAEWVTATAAQILCPAAPVDARAMVVYAAPASPRALRQTALDTYLQSIHAWGDEPYPGADGLNPDPNPMHAPLPPREIGAELGDGERLDLTLWRTEVLNQRRTEFFLEDHEDHAFTLYQNATKADAMDGFARTASVRRSADPD